jgi:ABC-type sulfate transport system permease component
LDISSYGFRVHGSGFKVGYQRLRFFEGLREGDKMAINIILGTLGISHMELLIDSFLSAILMVISMDAEMVAIIGVSLRVSCTSTVLAGLIGVPLGFVIAFDDFTGKRMTITVLNTLLALPTVVIGLFVYAFVSRRGI